MIVVISSEEEMTLQEIEVLTFIEMAELDIRFHLRKPGWTINQHSNWVNHAKDYISKKRLSVHNHQVKGCRYHAPERIRKSEITNASSTSFHQARDAFSLGDTYDYFFCSPVFPSISKPGYQPTEAWIINEWPVQLRKKAVALGGIDLEKLEAVAQKGFEHIALCGALWKTQNPTNALKQIIKKCQDTGHFV